MKNQKRNLKQNLIKNIIIIASIGIIFTQSAILSFEIPDIHSKRLNIPTNAANHDPILINGNSELATFIENEGLSGDGTEISPYIIEGYTINASTANGIDIRNTDAYLIIQDCTIESGNSTGYSGISLNNTAKVNVNNNQVIDNDYGIILYESNDNIILENNASYNGNGYYKSGIALKYSNNNTISSNDANHNNRLGIYVLHSNENIISENYLYYNIFGFVQVSSHNNIVSRNNASTNGGGLHFDHSNNNTITRNDAFYNVYDGIYLFFSENNTISGNNANDNSWGINLNYICNKSTVSGNNANFNEYSGIVLGSPNLIVTGNNANYNKNGIGIGSSNNKISSNNVSYNEENGIYLDWFRDNNTITGNNISYNDEYGIYLKYSSNNTIYFNDIYGNQIGQAYEEGDSINNQWDNGTIGNYWGDYNEKYPNAKNDDTFWNTPYEINGDGNGTDNFPLVNSISIYEPPERIKISGFPIVDILIFISVGVFLLKRKVIHRRIK